MKDAAEYLAQVKALIVMHPQVAHWTAVREEAQGDVGLLRYKLVLGNGGVLEMFERFQVGQGTVEVGRYSFHWQDAAGELYKRWDNAPHHPEVLTHPHHVHDGDEANLLSCGPVTAEEVLAIVAAEGAGKTG